MLPLPPRPPPDDDLQFVLVSSLAAALAKLNVNIPMETLLKTIREEDEAARRANLTVAGPAQRRAALSQLALQPPQPTAGLQITTVSHFVPEPTKPANVDPLAEKRRRRLIELTEEAFPDDKVPDPFMVA